MTDVSDQAPITFGRVLENRLDEISNLAEQFGQWAIGAGVPQATVGAVNLMLDELITNIVTYGYPARQSGQIRVEVQLASGRLEVLLTDYAVAHDPLQAPAPNLESSIEARQIGGLGVYFVRQLADEVAYERLMEGECGANQVRIVKRYDLDQTSAARSPAGGVDFGSFD
ncbi:MAG: ATP-binding protein [Ramlibacter sp.]